MCPPLGLRAAGHTVPVRATIRMQRPAPSYSTDRQVSAVRCLTLACPAPTVARSFGRTLSTRGYPHEAWVRIRATGPGGGHWRQWNVPTDLWLAHVGGFEAAAMAGLCARGPRHRHPLAGLPRPPAR